MYTSTNADASATCKCEDYAVFVRWRGGEGGGCKSFKMGDPEDDRDTEKDEEERNNKLQKAVQEEGRAGTALWMHKLGYRRSQK